MREETKMIHDKYILCDKISQFYNLQFNYYWCDNCT